MVWTGENKQALFDCWKLEFKTINQDVLMVKNKLAFMDGSKLLKKKKSK